MTRFDVYFQAIMTVGANDAEAAAAEVEAFIGLSDDICLEEIEDVEELPE